MSTNLPWMDAYIGLGSNLNKPAQQIESAQQQIAALPQVELVAHSPLYRSNPVGPQDQPDYVNAVTHIKTRLAPLELLQQLQAIENAHGRLRLVRWGARTLDLDVLLYGEQLIDLPTLQVPHPELTRRAFVLYPLADVAVGDLSIPGKGTLNQLLAQCPADGLQRLTA